MAAKLPSAILFDADGTLYDSESLHFEATRQTAKELHDFDFPRELFIDEMLRGRKSGHEVLLDQGHPSDEYIYKHHKQKIFEALVDERLTPMPGVKTFLEWCKKHDIECAVITSARAMQLEACLKSIGIDQFFTTLVTTEIVGGKRKPDPFPFAHGLELLGLTTDQALAVEDTGKGIRSAKAAGLRCAAIRNDDNDDEELSEADFIFDQYSELRHYLTGSMPR